MATKLKPFIGSVEAFVLNEDFELYVRRLDHLFTLNAVKEEEKVAFLCSLGGPELYKVIVSLTNPKTENDFPYKDLTKKLNDHFKPKRNIIAECYKFFKRNRKADEEIAEFVVELKQLAQQCEFGEFLDKALLIQFVCGVGDERIQQRLLGESELKTFEKAIQIANAVEMTSNNVVMIKEEEGGANVLRKSFEQQRKIRQNYWESERNNAEGRARSNNGEQSTIQKWNSKNYGGEVAGSNATGKIRRRVVCFRCGREGHIQKFADKEIFEVLLKKLMMKMKRREVMNYVIILII